MSDLSWFNRNQIRIARIATIALFLGLIRCILEIVRLQHYSEGGINYELIFPFVMGSAIAATGLFVMTIFSFYSKHHLIIVVAGITLAGMIAAKFYFDV